MALFLQRRVRKPYLMEGKMTNSARSGAEAGSHVSQASDPFADGNTARGTAGGNDPARSEPTGSPGGDPGSGTGGDMEYTNQLQDEPAPQEGIATRAAREQTHEDDPDNPSKEPGSDLSGTTPGYTP